MGFAGKEKEGGLCPQKNAAGKSRAAFFKRSFKNELVIGLVVSAFLADLGRALKEIEDLAGSQACDFFFVHAESHKTAALFEAAAVLLGTALTGTGLTLVVGFSDVIAHDSGCVLGQNRPFDFLGWNG